MNGHLSVQHGILGRLLVAAVGPVRVQVRVRLNVRRRLLLPRLRVPRLCLRQSAERQRQVGISTMRCWEEGEGRGLRSIITHESIAVPLRVRGAWRWRRGSGWY